MKITSRSYQVESLSSVGLHMIFAIVSFCYWLVCIFSIFYNEMCCFYKEKIKCKLEMEGKKKKKKKEFPDSACMFPTTILE